VSTSPPHDAKPEAQRGGAALRGSVPQGSRGPRRSRYHCRRRAVVATRRADNLGASHPRGGGASADSRQVPETAFQCVRPTVDARPFCQSVDEGVDIALWIGNLTDSTHITTRIGGDVRRVVVASPDYLANRNAIREPGDLLQHDIIAFSNFGIDSWAFSPVGQGTIPRTVHFSPRYVVNSVRAAAASAAGGMGVTRLYSYHVAELVRDGALKIILSEYEPSALPVHLLTPQGRISVPKVRAFIDFAGPKLKAALAKIAAESGALAQIMPKIG